MEIKKSKIKWDKDRKKNSIDQIRKQIEFYFSDANLQKDRFLKKEVTSSEDGFVDVEMFLQFNKLRSLTQNLGDVITAIQSSSLIKMDESGRRVGRVNKFQEPLDSDERTVYVEFLPSHASVEWVERVFRACGRVVYVSLPKFKSTGDLKGFAFVEFESRQQAELACETMNTPPLSALSRRPGMFPRASKSEKQLEKKLQRNSRRDGCEQEDEMEVTEEGEKERKKRDGGGSGDDDGGSKTRDGGGGGDGGSKIGGVGGGGGDDKDAGDVDTKDPSLEKVEKTAPEERSSEKKKKKKRKLSSEGGGNDDDGLKEKKNKKRRNEDVLVEGSGEGESVADGKGDDDDALKDGEKGKQRRKKDKTVKKKENDVDGKCLKREGGVMEGNEDKGKMDDMIKENPDEDSTPPEKAKNKSEKKKKKNKKESNNNKLNNSNSNNNAPSKGSQAPRTQLRVISKAEWLRLKREYLQQQKEKMVALKQKIRQVSQVFSTMNCNQTSKPSSLMMMMPAAATADDDDDGAAGGGGDGDGGEVKTNVNGLVAKDGKKENKINKITNQSNSNNKSNINNKNNINNNNNDSNAATAALSYVEGCILKVTLQQAVSKKCLKELMEGGGDGSRVAFIDMQDGLLEGHVRLNQPQDAQVVKSLCPPAIQCLLLSGEDEKSYWDKIFADREKRLSSKSKNKKRGKDKVVKKADDCVELIKKHQHILFE